MTRHRYRCTACGNLTRFDVTTTRTTRAFHHYTVGGDLQVEDEVVVAEAVDEVSCRWCGHGRFVELAPPLAPAPELASVEEPEAPGAPSAPGASAPSTAPSRS